MLTVIALDFDSPFVDRASRSTGGFQLRQNGVKVRCDMIEPRDDGHGLALAAFLSANAGGLVLGQQDYAGFAAWAGALRQGSFAYLAGDGALQRCSIKQARQRESPPASRRRWKSVRMVSSSGGRATTYRYTLPFAPLIFSRFIFFSLTKEPSVL